MSTEKGRTPQELYHFVWSLVLHSFWFKERLGDWYNWEHRFDDELFNEADVFRFGTKMLESLREEYTELQPKDEDDDDETEKPCCIAEMLPGRIGYIKISTFAGKQVAKQIQDAMQSIQDAVAFVVDLRRNTGGNLGQANKALSLFLDEGNTYIFQKRSTEDGYFEAKCRIDSAQFVERTEYELRAGQDEELETWSRYDNVTGDKPLIVLVNGRTGSAAELFAGVLRDNDRAVLLGSNTIGKGIGQHTIPVGDSYQLQITDSVFLPPSGQWFGDVGQTVSNGIVPDLAVDLNEDGDSQLAAALNRLSSVLAPAHHMQYRAESTRSSAGALALA